MTSTSTENKKTKGGKSKSNEEVLLGFQRLRSEQRYLSNKLSNLELELHEHKMVIDTLAELDGDRKCFRMIGGVLCQRTVKDVLPVLKTNKENLKRVIDTLNQQLVAKGVEINKYKDEHNVKFRNVDEFSQVNECENKSTSSEIQQSTGEGGGGSGVLVS